MKRLEYRSIVFVLLVFASLSGCTQPRQVVDASPAHFWGSVGVAYEASSRSGGGRHGCGPTSTTVIGFEKQLRGGLGIGAEVAGSGN